MRTFAIVCIREWSPEDPYRCPNYLDAMNIVEVKKEDVEFFFDEHAAGEGDHCTSCGDAGDLVDISDYINDICRWSDKHNYRG